MAVLAAGALVYPAMRLYQYIAQRRRANTTQEENHAPKKHLFSAYRGKNKHRHARVNANGELNAGMGLA